jgi:DNA-damage-inducible protein D
MTAKEIIKLAVFEGKQIRKIIYDGDWWFSVIDVVGVLSDSDNPRDYWYRIKQREKISGFELSTICRQFKLEAPDGKMRVTDCANAKGLLRLIQSIPSPKAEPFKQWLAQVGYERIQEIENPELAQERMKQLYEQEGVSNWYFKLDCFSRIVRHYQLQDQT